MFLISAGDRPAKIDHGTGSASAVQDSVELVGDVLVIERNGMGIVAQRSGRITVAETGLGLEHLASIDEMRRDPMAEAMQRRPFDPGGPTARIGSADEAAPEPETAP